MVAKYHRADTEVEDAADYLRGFRGCAPPARLWTWTAHVMDLGSVQVPTAACHCRSRRLNDLANEADRGGMPSPGQDPCPHDRPIPWAMGSSARQAVYLCLDRPSLRVSRSRSAAFCEAWVETTFHLLKVTSTTIQISIGTFFNVIVHPSRFARSSCT
jgi:hypothetical protein